MPWRCNLIIYYQWEVDGATAIISNALNSTATTTSIDEDLDIINWLLEGDILLQNYWSMLTVKVKESLSTCDDNILSSTIIILNVSVVSFAFHSRHLQHHHSRCRKSHDNSQARVAIGFFGISRSLSSTVESIERHAFDVLHRSNIRYWQNCPPFAY
jgi:hypothetical protein